MDLTIVKIPEIKYSVKCPYEMNAEGITVHNTANDASAMAEVSYMIGNDKQVSFHEAVDDYRVVQGIPHNRNAWNCGDGGKGFGNRKTISLEICYSKSRGEKFDLAEKNAAKRIAQILKERNWSIEKVGKHQDRNKKYCPHRTLDLGWERFLNMIREELGQTVSNVAENKPVQKDTTVLEWQKMMNRVYNCGLAEDNCFGPDSKAKANKYCLYRKRPLIINEHVKFMQQRLCKHGFNVDIDNKFGPDCELKTIRFQESKGLKKDGKIGANTTKELLK